MKLEAMLVYLARKRSIIVEGCFPIAALLMALMFAVMCMIAFTVNIVERLR